MIRRSPVEPNEKIHTLHPARAGIAALVLLCVVWSYTWIAMKEALRFADPFDFAAIRTVAGALLLFGVMLWLKQPLALRAAPRVLVLGLFQTTGFNAFVSSGPDISGRC